MRLGKLEDRWDPRGLNELEDSRIRDFGDWMNLKIVPDLKIG